ILASGSRGGIVALIVGLLLAAAFSRRVRGILLSRRMAIVLGLVGVGAIVALVLPMALGYGDGLFTQYIGRSIDDILGLVTSLVSPGAASGGISLSGRLYAQLASFGTWLSHNPLIGIGEASLEWGSHGQLADSLAENGVVGGLLVVAFYVGWYRRGVRPLSDAVLGSTACPEQVLLSRAALPLFIMWLVFSVTYGYWFQPFYIVVPAMLVAAARLNAPRVRSAPAMVACADPARSPA
ncbi:MAG: hypothetical protein ACYC5O_16335, partial [Anaerolineae bacterium]